MSLSPKIFPIHTDWKWKELRCGTAKNLGSLPGSVNQMISCIPVVVGHIAYNQGSSGLFSFSWHFPIISVIMRLVRKSVPAGFNAGRTHTQVASIAFHRRRLNRSASSLTGLGVIELQVHQLSFSLINCIILCRETGGTYYQIFQSQKQWLSSAERTPLANLRRSGCIRVHQNLALAGTGGKACRFRCSDSEVAADVPELKLQKGCLSRGHPLLVMARRQQPLVTYHGPKETLPNRSLGIS